MVAVVTDSASNLPPDVAAALGIEVVPMYLKFGEHSYRDGVDLVGEDFYERLLRDGDLASTAAPSPGDFLDAFEAAPAGEVVCVTVASSVSFTYQAACMARDQSSRQVAVVDSGAASMAEGFVAMEAARAARLGRTAAEVAARAREVADGVRLFAAIDTFEFLRKSGRVGKLQAYAATRLDIKAVFGFRGGDPGPVARPRTRARALGRVVEETRAEIGDRPVHLAAIHAAAEDEARDIMQRVAAGANVVESFVSPFTPVMGAHTGPGVVGLAFFCD
jgi:DegV family protein with EDD domain